MSAFLKDPLFFALLCVFEIPSSNLYDGDAHGIMFDGLFAFDKEKVDRQLSTAKTGISHQLGKLTDRPTLRWI